MSKLFSDSSPALRIARMIQDTLRTRAHYQDDNV